MGIVLALVTAFSFACSNILIRRGMDRSKGDNGYLMTVIINLIVLGIVAFVYRVFVDSIAVTLIGLILFGISGVFTTFLGRITLFMSFREIGPSRGVAIKNSAPLFTILFAVLLLDEVLGLLPLLGTFFVLLGLGIQGFFLVYQSSAASPEEANLKRGYFLALFSAFVFGIGQAVRKPGLEEIPDPFFGAFISSLIAVIIVLLYEWKKGVLKENIQKQMKAFNLDYVWSGVFTSVAMLSFFLAITYIQVSYVAAIAATEPLLTILLSKFLLKKQEHIAKYTIVSALLVFTGVIIIILFV